jgi:FkbM family methyltransferase
VNSSTFDFLDITKIEAHRSLVAERVLTASKAGKLGIVGSAALSQKCAAALGKAGGGVPFLIEYDVRFWGRKAGQWDVIGGRRALEKLGPDALLISGVWSPNHSYCETKAWAICHGFNNILPVSAIFWALGDAIGPHYQISNPNILSQHRSQVEKVYGLLADDISRKQYLGHIRWRATLDETDIPIWDRKRVYFGADFYTLDSDARIADIGAFDGDSLRAYLYWRGDQFGMFDAYEPDPISFDALKTYVQKLPLDVASRVRPRQMAMGEKSGLLSLYASGMPGSRLTNDAGSSAMVEVPIGTVDEVYGQDRLDFLKLDIEGGELAALTGAQVVIARDRPVIAVAIYHKPHDIFSLPEWLADRTGGYNYFLRSHDADGIDLVFYAVPHERGASSVRA